MQQRLIHTNWVTCPWLNQSPITGSRECNALIGQARTHSKPWSPGWNQHHLKHIVPKGKQVPGEEETNKTVVLSGNRKLQVSVWLPLWLKKEWRETWKSTHHQEELEIWQKEAASKRTLLYMRVQGHDSWLRQRPAKTWMNMFPFPTLYMNITPLGETKNLARPRKRQGWVRRW